MLQYQTLRKEIETTKERTFKIIEFGIIAVPLGYFVAQTYKIEFVLIPIPFLAIVIALLYLSENHNMMRCGRYIRLHIEPEIPEVIGWEAWLEKPGALGQRTSDKFVSFCVYLLFSVYFIGAALNASIFINKTYGSLPLFIALAVYIPVGLWFFIYLVSHVRSSTTTKEESQ